MHDLLNPESNVRITVLENGKPVDTLESHNVVTNIGRNWLRNLVGAASYPASGSAVEGVNALTSARVRYMGFGVGGSLGQTGFFNSQEELVTVTTLEDYVKITDSNPVAPATRYLVQVLPQVAANKSFPTNYSIRFTAVLSESLISYEGNISRSGTGVGTNVPISEAGLYISTADPGLAPDVGVNPTSLVAYNIFSPISVTPNITLRVDWEFRF
jgi:hypothetical protein